MTKKRHKHIKPATKVNRGIYHNEEFLVLGSNDENIKKWIEAIAPQISHQLSIGFLDIFQENSLNTRTGQEIHRSQIINHIKIKSIDALAIQIQFGQNDILFVNGNHFETSRQILLIDSDQDINKWISKINDPFLIILMEETKALTEQLREHLDANDIPVLRWHEHQLAIEHIIGAVSKPELYGLVLAGGKSTRMNQDKGLIDYHGINQRQWTKELLETVCDKVFYSIRHDQKDQFSDSVITDKFIELGPYGAILSAFQTHPNKAWLVMACDLPLVKETNIHTLIENRDTAKFGTAYLNLETNFPDPLMTIWEPKSYPKLLQLLSLGYSSPQKALMNSDIKLVKAQNTEFLKNVNTPKEYEEVKKSIAK